MVNLNANKSLIKQLVFGSGIAEFVLFMSSDNRNLIGDQSG